MFTMLQTKHMLPLSILLPFATPSPHPPIAHTTALLTAHFSPTCPGSHSHSENEKGKEKHKPKRLNYDDSPSLSLTPNSDESVSLDSSSHPFELTSTVPLAPNICVGVPVPLEFSSQLVDHLSVEALIQHPSHFLHGRSDSGHGHKSGRKESCTITVHELPGCEQSPVLEVDVGEGDNLVKSKCVEREFLAFEVVWARLNCEVEVEVDVEEVKKGDHEHEHDHDDELHGNGHEHNHDDELHEHGLKHGHEDKDSHEHEHEHEHPHAHEDKNEAKDKKKPWTQHGGMANSTVPATKRGMFGGKRRAKLPIF